MWNPSLSGPRGCIWKDFCSWQSRISKSFIFLYQVLKGQRYDEKADVYSFGILLWEIETRDVPYRGRNQFLLQAEITNGLRPEIRHNMDESVIRDMKHCWKEEPATRPSFSDLYESRLELEDVG
jgi:hypothetical protein